jgi:hypothetical protein
VARLRRKPSLALSSDLSFALERVVSVEGAGLEVRDLLTFKDAFAAGDRLEAPVPSGLRALSAEPVDASDKAVARVVDGKLIVAALEETSQMRVRVALVPESRDAEGRRHAGLLEFPRRRAVFDADAASL